MPSERKAEPPVQPSDAPPSEAAVTSRRNHMAALWAAELLGLIGKAAHDYAREVAEAHSHLPGDEHVVGRLAQDLKGVVTAHEIREKLGHLWHEARRQLLREEKRR